MERTCGENKATSHVVMKPYFRVLIYGYIYQTKSYSSVNDNLLFFLIEEEEVRMRNVEKYKELLTADRWLWTFFYYFLYTSIYRK